MDEEYRSGPRFIVPIGAVVAVVIVLLVVLRMRRPSKDERALAPIVKAIEDAEIPDAAKAILRESADHVRQALASLRTMASELAHHS